MPGHGTVLSPGDVDSLVLIARPAASEPPATKSARSSPDRASSQSRPARATSVALSNSLGGVPGEDDALDERHQAEEDDAHERENAHGREGERRLPERRRDDDQVAEALVGLDELADDGAHDRERHRHLEAAEDEGHRRREADLRELLEPRGLERAAQVEELGGHGAEPGGGVDHDREEGDQEGDEDLRRLA